MEDGVAEEEDAFLEEELCQRRDVNICAIKGVAGGRGRGLRSVKSRDRDCTILRYPALQNPTGLFDFAQDSLK